MTLAALLAQEVAHKTLWNPTILGVLVVLSAIGLFCGSTYLLLSTNLGARLGFLVASASLFGFLTLLSLLWITTFTPLESPKGRDASWKVKEVVSAPTDSKIPKVEDIQKAGTSIPTSDIANIRPFIDAAFVQPAAPPAGAEAPTPSPYAKFAASTDYLIGEQGLKAYDVGGGTKNLFWHYPRYAALEFCTTKVVEVPFGEKPPNPSCDPLIPHQFVIMERDLGSLRQPPWVYFGAFVILLALSLLGLHWYELDQREAKRRAAAPVPAS